MLIFFNHKVIMEVIRARSMCNVRIHDVRKIQQISFVKEYVKLLCDVTEAWSPIILGKVTINRFDFQKFIGVNPMFEIYHWLGDSSDPPGAGHLSLQASNFGFS